MPNYICYETADAHIAVCEKAFWEENGYLDDRHNRELTLLMQRLHFTETRTNIFWRPNGFSNEQALALLEENGIEVVSRKNMCK